MAASRIGAELGEGGDLAVLGELELEGAGDLLHLALALRGCHGRRAPTQGRSECK